MDSPVLPSSQNHASMSDKSGKSVEVHPLNFGNYAYEELYCKIDQIIDPNAPVRHIMEIHILAVDQSASSYGFDYGRAVMAVSISATVSLGCHNVGLGH